MTAMLPAVRKASKMGRGGDTLIAHLNEDEAAMLRAMGGAGTRNPKTGLLEFRYDRADTKAAGTSGTAGGDRGGGGRTGNSGGNGGGGLSDKDITGGAGWGSNDDINGPTIERPFGMGKIRPEPFAPSGPYERWGMTVGTAPDLQKKQDDYNSAWDDRLSGGFGGWVRNRLLNAVPGFRQEDPNWNDPMTYDGGTFHDSWSPWGAAASLAAMAAPVPGLSVPVGLGANALADAAGAERYVFGPNGGWGPAVSEPGPTAGPKAQAKEDALKAMGDTGPADRTAVAGAHLLPAVMGIQSSGALAAAPQPVAPSPGVALPPVSAPRTYPGAYRGVPGPSIYGWNRPTWTV